MYEKKWDEFIKKSKEDRIVKAEEVPLPVDYTEF
jgi:hypothetical protein